MKKNDVALFYGVTTVMPAQDMNRRELIALRRKIGDETHRPLNALKQTTFHVCAICYDRGVLVMFEGNQVWVKPNLLQPVAGNPS